MQPWKTPTTSARRRILVKSPLGATRSESGPARETCERQRTRLCPSHVVGDLGELVGQGIDDPITLVNKRVRAV